MTSAGPCQQPLRAVGRRPAVADHVRAQDQGAGVPGLPVHRRADRRPLPRPRRALHRDRATSGSHSPTACTSTRSTPRRSTGGTTSWSCSSPTAPEPVAGVKALAPTLYATAMGIGGIDLPDDPIQTSPTYAAALAAFEGLPSVRVLFDNGAGSRRRGRPSPGFEHSFSRFPVPGTAGPLVVPGTRRAAGRERTAGAAGRSTFTWDKRAVPATDFTGNTGAGGLWGGHPDLQLGPEPAGHLAVVRERHPSAQHGGVRRRRAAGAGSRRRPPDVDLQVDGLRGATRRQGDVRAERLAAGERAQARSTPEHAARARFRRSERRDVRRCPKGRFTKVTVPLYYEGHAYRAGSRIRITISAPNGESANLELRGDRAEGPGDRLGRVLAQAALAHGAAGDPRRGVPTSLPPCPGLRGEPCRPYVP